MNGNDRVIQEMLGQQGVVLFQLERSLIDYVRTGRSSLERSLFGLVV
jgi:hypothetical protein